LNGSIKPLRGKENYTTWLIKIETILLRNNNAAYIRNGSRAARPRTRYLDDYTRQLEQYNRDLEVYTTAAAAFEAAARQEAVGQQGQAPVRPVLLKKPDKAKEEEKALKT
jgi:hypothetical protein